MVIATWKSKTFEVSAEKISSFEKLTMGVELETKSKTKSKQEYKVRKKTKPRTFTLDISLHEMLGVDVEGEVQDWQSLCHKGKGGKFYVGGRSIGPCSFLLTSAKVTEAEIGPTKRMTSAKLSLSFEQSSKNSKQKRILTPIGAFNVLISAKAQSKAVKSI